MVRSDRVVWRPGIRSSGKKAELVERLATNSAYLQSVGGARTNGGGGNARANGAIKRAAHAEVTAGRFTKSSTRPP